jgi:hypothetical protein
MRIPNSASRHFDPDARAVEVFALHEAHWHLDAVYKEDAPVSAPPIEELSFTLDALWVQVGRFQAELHLMMLQTARSIFLPDHY